MKMPIKTLLYYIYMTYSRRSHDQFTSNTSEEET